MTPAEARHTAAVLELWIGTGNPPHDAALRSAVQGLRAMSRLVERRESKALLAADALADEADRLEDLRRLTCAERAHRLECLHAAAATYRAIRKEDA